MYGSSCRKTCANAMSRAVKYILDEKRNCAHYMLISGAKYVSNIQHGDFRVHISCCDNSVAGVYSLRRSLDSSRHDGVTK